MKPIPVATFAALLGAGFLLAAPARPTTAYRDPAQQPFASSSVWNTPLGLGARFQSGTEPATAMLRNENTGGPAASYSWIDGGAIQTFRAAAGDPESVWSYDSRSATTPWPDAGPTQHGKVSFPTPKTIKFGGVDGWAIVILPDGKTAYEVWKGAATGEGTFHANYIVRTDLTGSGIASHDGQSAGIRAAGVSLAGGLIRCDELAKGFIPHGIAMTLSTAQMLAGPTAASQKVWPASTTDNDGKNAYAGLIPMGALIGIPPGVKLETLGLSPEGLTLAKAYQQFGGYVVDTAGKTMILGMAEACPAPVIANLQKDKRIILNTLALVTNNSPGTPGGPGDRIVPRPPALAGESADAASLPAARPW